jgi:dTDP-glucose 4,6-dehydratase
MNETVLVIGASSFTGKHFCAYARQQGATVIEASLRSPFEPLFDAIESAPEYVVNFAAANVVAPSWEYPEAYMRVNVEMQIPIWDALRKQPIRKYVHVSTPEVYGNTRTRVYEDAPYNPSTPYAVSRVAAELMLKCYHKRYGFPVVFTRACNVYGPGRR